LLNLTLKVKKLINSPSKEKAMQPIVSYGEANVTYFRVKVIQGYGDIPLPPKDL
jgi:hypothetical protein